MRAAVRLTDEQQARIVTLSSDGMITPTLVVDDARSLSSPLHELFEWDDAKAAEAHRLTVARVVIRSVRYKREPDQPILVPHVQHYLRDPDAAPREQGYVSVPTLLTDRDRARRALQGEFEKLEGWIERVREIAIALDLDDELEHLIAQVVRMRDRAAA